MQPGVLFEYRPESDFTRTVGWLLITIPLLLAAASLIDFFRGGSTRLLVVNLGIGILGAAAMYGLSKGIDRAQERCRLTVHSDGTLRWRNTFGRVRHIPLDDAEAFEIKEIRKKPGMLSAARHKEHEAPRGLSTAPEMTQIRVCTSSGRKRSVTVGGSMPNVDQERLRAAMGKVMPQGA